MGLGVDGSASNDGSNLMQEVRQALLLQRLKYGSFKVSHRDVLVSCGAHRADHVMVAGKWVVESGEIPELDLPGFMFAHRRLAGDLLK